MYRPAIVLGGNDTALGVVRALGVAGLPVVVLDSRAGSASVSRYASFVKTPDPRIVPGEFLAKLEEVVRGLPQRPVAHVTSDPHLAFLLEHRAPVESMAFLRMTPTARLRQVMDKMAQSRLAADFGVAAPMTVLVEKIEDVEIAASGVLLPAIVKGRDSVSWRAAFGPVIKGFVVGSAQELREALRRVLDAGVSVLVQELIPGPDTEHFKVSAVLSAQSRCLTAVTLQKIRQSPPGAGVACVIRTVAPGDLQRLAVEFFERAGLQGVISAEFKRDARDGAFKLIEINPRYWQQNYLTLRAGINFALIHHLDAAGDVPPRAGAYEAGIKWVDPFRDFETFREMHAEGRLGTAQWLHSLRGRKCFSSLSWSDPRPGWFTVRREFTVHARAWSQRLAGLNRGSRNGRS